MSKPFLCSDESINSYGSRVITSGIRLENFKKNPVGFLNHDTGGSFWSSDNTYTGPMIRWEDITVDGANLKATPIFFTGEPKSKTVADKVEQDFIRAASIGFRIIKTSEDPADMLPGQTRPTITECELVEISVVDIPANKNAIALFDKDMNRIELSDEASFEKVNLGGLNKNPINTIPMKKFKLSSALAFAALSEMFSWTKHEEGKDRELEISEDQLSDLDKKLATLKALEAENTSLKADAEKFKGEKAELETQLKAAQDAKTAVETDVNGKLTALTSEIDALKDHMKKIKVAPVIPAEQIALNAGGSNPSNAADKTVDQVNKEKADLEAKIKAHNSGKA